MKTRIVSLKARQVWDSRGRPTVEAEAALAGGASGRAIAPAGASRGAHEAVDRRDGGARFGGMGVDGAVEGVNGELARALEGLDAADQAGVDAAIVVAEPTANYPYVGHKGLVWFEIETTGVTAHGSMPEVGDNAINKMARVIGDLEGFRFPVESHPVMGSPTLNVGTIRGGLNTNSVPDSAKITVDVRTVPGIDHGHLCHSLETLLGPRGAKVKPIVDTPALYTEPEAEWVQEVFEVATPFLEGRPTPKTITFSTDGAWLKPGYGGPPAVILGPGEPRLAHQTDEWCSLARIEQSVDVFATLMRRWCGV